MEYVITWGSFWAGSQLGIPAETGPGSQEIKASKTEREMDAPTYSFHAPCSYCGNLAAQA